jgi:curved DNA-binding protein CbpA
MARVPFDPATDYYQLLGVAPGASAEDIQAAYRRLAKEYHPDVNAGSAAAAARMARVNVAKAVLLDRDTRASYDQVRAVQRPYAHGVVGPHAAATTVRYAPYHTAPRPRHRVVSNGVKRESTQRFDRGTGILLLVALPLIAALALYVFQAFQLSIEPLREAPIDASLPSSPVSRTTSRGAADSVFMMVRAQPPSRELATRAYNFSMARADSTPESELLRADARRLLRAAAAGDTYAWEAAVADLCRLAGHCD